MEPNKPPSDEKPTSNNCDILLEIVNDLTHLKNSTKEELITKGLDDTINKINAFIKIYSQNMEEIIKCIISLDDEGRKKFDKININIVPEKIKYEEGNYIGQVDKGLPEGKGASLFDCGDKYEGDCKNGQAEGKGIKQWINGDRYEGEYKNDRKDGKGIYFYHNGDRYEGEWEQGMRDRTGFYYYKNGDRYDGDWKGDKKQGKGVYYYRNGDRRMGNYLNDKPIGKHVLLTKDGEVQTIDFN